MQHAKYIAHVVVPFYTIQLVTVVTVYVVPTSSARNIEVDTMYGFAATLLTR